MTQPAPFGSWRSPITADLIVTGTVGLEQVTLDCPDIYWIETRPTEGGRQVIVRRTPDGAVTDCTPAPYNARTRVHEYGGASYLVHQGAIYFTNFADQCLYRQDPGAPPRPLTGEGDVRYADAVFDARRSRLLGVREAHTSPGQPVNSIVSIETSQGDVRELVSGSDFYAAPRLSPDGQRLAWLAWNHPNMPWDGTELWVGELDDAGALVRTERVAGGPEESIFQPEWSPAGELYFVSDRTGWWNLYRWRVGRVEALVPKSAEFGRPQWLLGMTTYAFESACELVCTYTERGTWRLARLDIEQGRLETIDTPYMDIRYLRAGQGHTVFVAGSTTEPLAVVQYDLASRHATVLRRSFPVTVDADYVSVPEAIEFPTEGQQTAHAFFYRPRNRDFVGLPGERPPLLVICHGGPTSATITTLRLEAQYWTSRGFAVVDVNYGGSYRLRSRLPRAAQRPLGNRRCR